MERSSSVQPPWHSHTERGERLTPQRVSESSLVRISLYPPAALKDLRGEVVFWALEAVSQGGISLGLRSGLGRAERKVCVLTGVKSE